MRGKQASNKGDKMEGKLFKVSIVVTGVKKRCRKTEQHFLSLGYIDYNEGAFNQDELSEKAKSFLSENMKEVKSTPKINLYYVERKKDNLGTIETMQFFDKRNVSFLVQSSLENALQ
jgi:hypothetical protein